MQNSKHLHDVGRHHLVLRHTRVGDSFPLVYPCVSGDTELARIAIEACASVGPLNMEVQILPATSFRVAMSDGARGRWASSVRAINSENLGTVDLLLQLGVPSITTYADHLTELIPPHLQGHADAGVLVARTALHSVVGNGSVEITDMLIRHRPDALKACVYSSPPSLAAGRFMSWLNALLMLSRAYLLD
ncbi:hypothetical protein PspLS_06988 [Pyricularia sp. CBS 133598]|nr:hypothetical protein PspLS_06988 [Pyricularia sp. CBS 133598]